ncbi:molybdopterin-binding protein [Oscillibacter sp. GMB15532]|uniref:molybdopterin-binding protein n=1 Tax=Oscillibacter sp. GMB15532 TaxID=3230022 RepID=UPI0034DE8901
MKLIKTREAVGHVLCHDLTQIIPGEYKGARFRKGHVVVEEDIPVLLSMGKENLYVWELNAGMLHEDDAALRLCGLSMGQNIRRTEDIKEGKIELFAECDGYFTVDAERLFAVNSVPDVMLATRKGGTAVRSGDKLAGMRVIPLIVPESTLEDAEAAAGPAPLLNVHPYKLKTAGIVTTGSEVKSGLIEDRFTPAVKKKLAGVGIETVTQIFSGDGVENVAAAIGEVRAQGVDLVLCTGGMSVDPDDNTPGGIRAAGAEIVTYGAPVLPGAMFLLGYFSDGVPIMGLPGCVMFAGATVFDLVLPRVAAGVPVTRTDIVSLGNGGLCLGCKPCHWPICPFGR